MNYDDLDKFSNNPGRAITALYGVIEDDLDTDVVGTFNGKVDPFTFMMDTVVGTHHVLVSRLADSLAKGYKNHARSIADLSEHMSDEDWEGVFGTPSTTLLRYSIPMEEIRRLALPFTSIDGELTNFYNKLVIPKDSIFKLPDANFWLGHAVEFRLMEHGGVQVLYDTTQTNPFSELGTNYPDRVIKELSGIQYVSVLLPVKQVSIKEIPNKSSNDVVGFSLTDNYDDKLYRIRAFIKPWGSTSRIEMTVVFKRTNFDPAYPTILIDLLDGNRFNATIPSVYLQNGLGIGDVTLLVYTTKGAYERDLTTLTDKYHTVEYFNYSNTKGGLNQYEKPILTVDDTHITSDTPITGGSDGTSFADLKNTLIYGHRRRDIPISAIDLTQTLKEYGYSTVKALDYPNYRLYRVTKELPSQSNKLYDTDENVKSNGTLGVYVGSVLNSLTDIVGLGIAKDNGPRITILPGSVIDVTQSTPVFYNQLTTDQLLNSSMKNKSDTVNEKTLVALPFHYVLDTTSSQARVRAYYLNNPSIVEQLFFYENPYLGISVGISKNSISITNDGDRYIIDIVTTSSDSYKNLDDSSVSAQIGIDIKEGYGAKTAKGILVGKNANKERMWRFIVETDFDIDSSDLIYFKGFKQYGMAKDVVTSLLTQRVNFIFTYQGDSTKEKSVSDTRIDQSLFDTVQTAIIETEFTVRFGKPLKALYTSIRPMIGSEQYQTYPNDVPDTYKETTYKYDNKELVIVNGKAVIEHRAGDVIKTSAGAPVILHPAGSIVYDANGSPIVKEPRKLLNYWDFVGFDYAYYLSQDEYDTEYLDSIRTTIADSIMDQLTTTIKGKFERTEIQYKPLSTIGFTKVVVNEGQTLEIKNDLRFSVVIYLTKIGIKDLSLRNSISASVNRIVNVLRKKSTISTSIFIKAIQDLSDEDIKEVKCNIYSGSTLIDVITNVDDTNGFGVRKKLAITSDNFLTIKEDIEVLFKQHKLDD